MFMIKREFGVAFDKAREINEILSYKHKDNKFVSLDDIVEAVKQVSKCSEIFINMQAFSELRLPKEYKDDPSPRYGAMLSTMTREKPESKEREKIDHLIVNSDNSADMQRFSVAHELGHLVTDFPNFKYEEADDGLFTISAHIDPDITYIPNEECENEDYLIAEQVANIFALLVLIPDEIKICHLKEQGAKELAKIYGVTEDAIYSRMLLASVNKP